MDAGQWTGFAAIISGSSSSVSIAVQFRQASNFERFSDAQKRRQFLLGDGNLSAIHVLDNSLEFWPARVLQNDNRMLAGIVEKEMLEIGRTGR